MKRILSLVLTLAMVLSLMAGICVSVGAEEYTYIEGAEISGTAIPTLNVGDTVPEMSFSVPAGANYTVRSVSWYDEAYANVAAGTVVENGKTYCLDIEVVANEGYAFAHGHSLLINGTSYSFVPINSRGEGFEYCEVIISYPFLVPIEKVELSYTEPKAGQVLSAVTVPTGAYYTAEHDWYDYTIGSWLETDAVAEKGGEYMVCTEVTPAEGYMFTEATQVWVNGQKVDNARIEFDYIDYYSKNYNLSEPISKVEITYAEPELGKALPVPTVAGDNCQLQEYYWYDTAVDETAPVDAVVEKGHSYELVVIAKPAAGYKFTEETKVTVNGAQPDEDLVSIYDDSVYYYSLGYDFTVELTEVSVTYAEPEVGKAFPEAQVADDAGYTVQTTWYDRYTDDIVEYDTVKDGGIYEMYIELWPEDGYKFAEEMALTVNGSAVNEDDYDWGSDWLSYDMEYSFAKTLDKFEISYEVPEIGKAPGAITIPEGANYTLDEYSGWYDYYTGEKVTGNFEDGKRYEMRADLKLNFGYEVSENAVVYVNGEKTTNFGHGDTTVYVMKSYSFAESVAEVDLPAWPELKVGDKLPEISGEGEHYEYYVDWYGEDADGNYLEGDTVVDGAIYYAYMYAYPKAGYEFTEDTKVTQNGKDPSGWLYTDYNYIELDTVYSFGVYEMIDKIELTTDIPGYGEKGGEVKAPEDADYEVEYTWGVASDDTYEDAKVQTETYQYGDRVLLVVFMDANDGYMFTPDVAITINGKEYEPVESDKYQDHVYMFYDLGEVTKPAATPETGDTTPVALLSFLCLSALAGVSILLNKKRIAR